MYEHLSVKRWKILEIDCLSLVTFFINLDGRQFYSQRPIAYSLYPNLLRVFPLFPL
jgi:hypothetical protein